MTRRKKPQILETQHFTVTVETGPLPSTLDPCYRQAPAAEAATEDRTQKQDSRPSGAHRSGAEGSSPI